MKNLRKFSILLALFFMVPSCGRTEQNVDDNPQGLAFYPLDDGTYAVSAGNSFYLSEVVIPSQYKGKSVTKIVENGFESPGNETQGYVSNLKNITIPDSIKEIGYGAFANCTSLASISIPKDVTSIGERTFSNCASLKTVSLPNSVTSIGAGAFATCSSLTSIVIPNSVTSIGADAFAACSSLTSIVIPNGVTSIELSTFAGCLSILSVTIPNTVTSLEKNSFALCSSLTSIVIPSSVTRLRWYSFFRCKSLTIYCEAESKPEGWDNLWNYCDDDGSLCPVVWGYRA